MFHVVRENLVLIYKLNLDQQEQNILLTIYTSNQRKKDSQREKERKNDKISNLCIRAPLFFNQPSFSGDITLVDID